MDAGDICTWQIKIILIGGKTWIPAIEAQCWEEYGTDSGISSLNLWLGVRGNLVKFF